MIKLATGLAVATLLGAGGALYADNGETVISSRTYSVQLDVSSSKLNCVFTPGHQGTYVPVNTAWVDLQLPEDDTTVFTHTEAGLTVQDQARNGRAVQGDARATCDHVAKVVSDAQAQGNKVTATQDVVLSILKFPAAYTENCSRDLIERVTVHLPYGIDLQSEQSRPLSPTSASDCKNRK